MPPVRRSVRLSAVAQTTGEVQHWLMKAEPESRMVKGIDVKFSIDDLRGMKGSISHWDGVRNFEARNIMRDRMRLGDRVLFYHSNCKAPGIAGTASVAREGYPDHTALDPEHPYYDPKSDGKSPKWYMVDVKLECKFGRIIPLAELKEHRALSDMALIKRGRLSVQPVRKAEYDYILALAGEQQEPAAEPASVESTHVI